MVGNEGHVQAHDLARNSKGVIEGFKTSMSLQPLGEEEAAGCDIT